VAFLALPLLSPPGKKILPGSLRFFTYQTMSVPFLLLGGSLLSQSELDPSNITLIIITLVLLSIGFMLALAIFPFHTWIPMIMKETNPYAAAFVIFIIPIGISFLSINYIEKYTLFNINYNIGNIIRLMGAFMAFMGGIWAAFDDHLGRIMGFSSISNIGISLLAISLLVEKELFGTFYTIYLAILLPLTFELAVWSLSLFIIQLQKRNLSIDSHTGNLAVLPFASISLIIANFSMASFPLLASFPSKSTLWSILFDISPFATLFSILGSIGILIAGIKTIYAFIPQNTNIPIKFSENKPQMILLSIGVLTLLIIGLAPQLYTPFLEQMALIITIR